MKRLAPFALAASLLPVAAHAGPDATRGRRLVDAEGRVALTLFADRDDDDDDGVADALEKPIGDAANDVVWIEPKAGAQRLTEVSGDAIRLVIDGRPVEPKAARGRRLARFGVQGVHAGKANLELSGLQLEVSVLEPIALDARGQRVDLARSHASISRTLPGALAGSDDRDALRWAVAGPLAALPHWLDVSSSRADRTPLDTLGEVELADIDCPATVQSGLACRATPFVRAASDVVDRSHPEASERSLLAEVGGRIVVTAELAMASLRVGGPRESALGPLERYRGRLRVRLVRVAPHGSPPVGGDEAGALAVGREEVHIASSLWGQCGIHFGFGKDLDVRVVDPPPPHLIAIGCDLAAPASGGELAFTADKQHIRVATRTGDSPQEVAARVAAAVKKAGLVATASANAPTSPGALRSVDVLVRKRDGGFVVLGPEPGQALTTDPTLGVCLGEVDLADGLSHFSDFDAAAGTVEERSLIKAFDDGDPTTIEVLVIPSFARSGRIGESFIYADGSSVRNAVIIDRMGIRAGARSFALAHELGHILLDMPGHPDDYGVDRPSALMDADAADPTIFGPRRLSVEECERALRQSGPDAPVPLLEPWPLFKPRK